MTAQPDRQSPTLSRRSVLKAAAALGAAAGLSGCMRGLRLSSGDSELEMMFWGEGDQNTKFLDAIKGWERSDGGSRVNAQYMPLQGYFDKLATRVAGGNPPDLFQIYLPYLSDYLSRDVIRPLDDFVEELDLANLPASIQPTVRMNGHYYYAVVGAATQPAIEYDADRLGRYGLRPASSDWTLEQFQQTMKQVRDASHGAIYGVSDLGGAAPQLESYMRALGTPLFTPAGRLAFTRDQFAQWLQMWDTMRRNGSCPPMPITVEATGFQNDPLVVGKTAYTLTATSRGFPSIQTLTKDRLGLLEFPRATAHSKPGTNIIPAGWFAISKNSRNVSKAIALLKYLYHDPRAARAMGLARGIPLAPAQQQAIKGRLDGQERLVFDNYLKVANQKLAPLQLYPAGSGQLLSTSLADANQSVGAGKASIRQATDQFFDDAKRTLQ